MSDGRAVSRAAWRLGGFSGRRVGMRHVGCAGGRSGGRAGSRTGRRAVARSGSRSAWRVRMQSSVPLLAPSRLGQRPMRGTRGGVLPHRFPGPFVQDEPKTSQSSDVQLAVSHETKLRNKRTCTFQKRWRRLAHLEAHRGLSIARNRFGNRLATGRQAVGGTGWRCRLALPVGATGCNRLAAPTCCNRLATGLAYLLGTTGWSTRFRQPVKATGEGTRSATGCQPAGVGQPVGQPPWQPVSNGSLGWL